MDLESLSKTVKGILGPDVLSCSIEYNELTLQVFPASIIRVLTLLRDNADCRFKVLIDICGADYPERPQRFDVVYHLLSVHLNQRIRVKLMVDEVTPVPSVVGVYSCANWYEREAWDMYGILFSDHPDLRRILTDYNFDGYPMRKDFPLTGYWEVRYDEESKRVVYDPVSLQQDFRTFDFMSPWEGAVRERVSNQVKQSASIDEKKAS